MREQFPEEYLRRMRERLGDQYASFIRTMEIPAFRGIRFNPLKPCAAAEGLRGEAVPWEKNGYYLDPDSTAGSTIWHEAGAFYLQEPSAMLPAAVLAASPGERMLDLCAAPGGKTTQIGADLRGQGLLISNEPVNKRAAVLSRNTERMGIPNTVVIQAMPDQLADRWAGLFDAVLADVPCSGEGMFRRDPAVRDEWSEEHARGCAARQREILKSAAELVRPGGRLVYSTCTFNPEENEKNIEWFLDRYPEFERVPFRLPGADAPEGCFTCYPHQSGGEGQFAALLRKKGDQRPERILSSGLPCPDRQEEKVFRESFPFLPPPTAKLRNTLVRLEDCPDLSGIRVLRAGLHLADLVGRTLVPDHAAAVCCFSPDVQRVSLNEEDAIRYLAGETPKAQAQGWALAEYDGLALGWGKGNGEILKNHYPKGIRRRLSGSMSGEAAADDQEYRL